jgi:nucleoside-diphosphate-sugar epimerase
MKIFLTGDSGFIGSYLCNSLEKNKCTITGIDVSESRNETYLHITGNILDKDILRKTMPGADCIIHLAAEHKDFGISKEQYYLVNVQGTKNLLDIASECNIKKFIYFSSVAVYGKNQPSDENTAPSPINHYGASKLAAEKEVRKWADAKSEREVLIIRPVVIFGAGNRANIYNLIKRVIEKKFFFVGKGDNVKSIAYIENLVAATYFLLERMKPGIAIYNYSDAPQLTTKQLVKLIADTANVSVPKITIPLSIAVFGSTIFDVLGQILHKDFPITSARMRKFATSTFHSSDKIRKIQFSQPYTLQEGLRKNIEWIQAKMNKEDVSYLHSEKINE